MSSNRIKVESKDSDGNDIVIYVTRPTVEEISAAQMESNKVFRQALTNGAMVRKTLEAKLEQQGIWDEEKQKQEQAYLDEIREHLTAIKAGGIYLKDGREHAIKVRMARMQLLMLQSEKNEYDSYTAEAQAEAAKIDYLTALCIKNEKGEPYFKDVEDYRSRSNEPFVVEAGSKLLPLIYGVKDDWEADLPENKFLRKYNFVDDDLRLVNKEGDYITIDGKKVNKDFQYVDDEGNIIDVDGNRIDDDGLPIVDSQPFLDDDGQPITD